MPSGCGYSHFNGYNGQWLQFNGYSGRLIANCCSDGAPTALRDTARDRFY